LLNFSIYLVLVSFWAFLYRHLTSDLSSPVTCQYQASPLLERK
jgi:hypothetical protein